MSEEIVEVRLDFLTACKAVCVILHEESSNNILEDDRLEAPEKLEKMGPATCRETCPCHVVGT